jgi:uncharacterized membrane protein
MRRLKRTLLTGLFIVAPFSLTFILISWFVQMVDRMLLPVTGLLGRPVPGLGLFMALLIIWGVGAFASNVAGQHLLEYFEEVLLRVPGINWLYKTIKQVAEVFSPAANKSFKRVVLIEYPRPEVWSMGFVTNEIELNGKTMVSVYVPTNHVYIGDFVLVPEEKTKELALSLQDGIQAALSAGASLPTQLK